MLSPPGSPPQNQAYRPFLESFSRSRSHSPSHSPLQPGSRVLPTAIGSDEKTGLDSGPILISPHDGNKQTSVNRAEKSPAFLTEQASPAFRQAAIPEPMTIGQQYPSHIRARCTQTSRKLVHTNSEPFYASSGTSLIIEDTEAETLIPVIRVRSSRNIAWNRLRESLQFLSDSSKFAPLSSCMDSLLSCLDGLEVTLYNRSDYENLAIELATLTQSLKPYTETRAASILSSKSTERIAMAIEWQVQAIQRGLARLSVISTPGSGTEEEELVRYYQKIQSHIRQLQMNASLSTWSLAEEHSPNEILNSMNHTEQAIYDSNLSIQIKRRLCTAGTRTGILDELDSWLNDSASSSIYWMDGMAGTGKTTVASTFCERVQRRKLLAASFFCSRNSAECRNVSRIVPTIAHQLALYSIPFQSALCQVLESNSDIGSKNMFAQFELLLKEPLQQVKDAIPDNLVVVIDALDECDDRNGVELVLDMLFRQAAQSLVRADIELYLKEELESASPDQSEIEQLAQHCGTLFIYAATLVRYITGKKSANSYKRLRAFLDMTVDPAKPHEHIDGLYATVLESALGGEGPAPASEDIRVVLWTVLLAQEPIRVETLTKLADIDDPQRAIHALQTLRSVLHQYEETGPVSTLHASFPDFMFSKERSGSYFCDIAGHMRDQDVENIQEQIKSKISPTLAYACRFWASHLVSAPKSDPLLQMLDHFLSYQLLFWVEVLSLQRELPIAVDGLLKAQRWLMARSPTSELSLFVNDARSFVTGFAINPVSQSTPHIYLSSLALCPQSNSVYKHYYKRARGLLKLEGSLMEHREAAPLTTWTVRSEIISLALSPDGTRVAIGCLDGMVSILSAYDGMVHVGPLEGHFNTIISVAFSPDGERVVSSSLGGIRVWNAYNGTLAVVPFKGHMRYINSVSFSPDGARIVSCGHDSTIRIWNAYDGTPLLDPLRDHSDVVLRVAFSPDGALIASSSADQTVRLWNSHTGALVVPPLRGHIGVVDSLAFTPDGTRLISGSNNKTIRVWNTSNWELVKDSFEGYKSSINTLAISPDSTRCAAGCFDKAVRVWRIDNGKLLAGPFFGHTNTITAVAFSPDGTRVFSSSVDKTIRVWNIRDGMFPPPPIPPQNALSAVKTVIFCPDSKHFLSSGGQAVLRMWDTTDGSFIPMPEEANFFPTPLSIVSPNGSYIASTSKEGMIQVTSTMDCSLVAGPFEVERSSLSAFWFSHNNRAIIMGCNDGTIKVCSLNSSDATVASFKGHHREISSLAESPDCSLLVSYSHFEFVLRVWNVATPSLDIQNLKNAAFDSTTDSVHSYIIYEGWKITEDGWVINKRRNLLFWLPPDIASAWCSPYATLVVTRSGTLRVPKQKPFIDASQRFKIVSLNILALTRNLQCIGVSYLYAQSEFRDGMRSFKGDLSALYFIQYQWSEFVAGNEIEISGAGNAHIWVMHISA
ncbi:hypothetical protein OPQ81_012032 [Rhizoctonia solani]|nr:hypothetical protein OPQ81_012032 [Rhizoctonia solani]